MKYSFSVLIAIAITTSFGYADLPPYDQKITLREFFQVLIEDSEAGYVFLNQKPMCILGYSSEDNLSVNHLSHRNSVALRAGAQIWKQLKGKKTNNIIHISEKEEPLIPGYLHVMVINTSLFHEVVNENLSLFQYILGPKITSQQLLEALTSKEHTFESVLKGNKVLVGILLGFGAQNSLYGNRAESIGEFLKKEFPPFLLGETLIQEYPQAYIPVEPGLGFISAKEELQQIEDQLAVSSAKLLKEDPQFVFGWLRDLETNQRLINDLEQAQEQIKKSLVSPLFLEETLEKLIEDKSLVLPKIQLLWPADPRELNKIIARGLWDSLQHYDLDYIPHFIEGMENPSKLAKKIERRAFFPYYRKEFLEAKNNLVEANAFFQTCTDDPHLTCIIPQKLYYKTLRMGMGEKLCKTPLVKVTCSIFSPLGHCLANYAEVILNLRNTIPGFAHGIQGMKIGETREIFIHPALAYGFDCSLEKCIHLRALVTLAQMYATDKPFPEVKFLDLAFLADPQVQVEREENYQMALRHKGSVIAQHLQKSSMLEIAVVIEFLKSFYNKKESPLPTTQMEQDLINYVHWNIYFAKDGADHIHLGSKHIPITD